MKLSDLAAKLDCRLDSDGDIEITGVAGLEDAQPGQIAFLANKRYTPLLKTTRASAVFVDQSATVSRDPVQAFLSTTCLRARDSSNRSHRRISENWGERPYRPALFRGRRCRHWQQRCASQLRFDLSWCAHWRRLLRSLPHLRAGILPHRE